MKLKTVNSRINRKYPKYLLTSKEAAEVLQMTSKNIYQLVKSGKLKPLSIYDTGQRPFRFRKSDLARLIKQEKINIQVNQ